MRAPSPMLILFVAGLSLAGVASADWPPGGMLLSSPGDVYGVRNARILELPSGDLIVLGVGVGGNQNTYRIQRVSRDGVIAPGWPAAGVGLTSVIKGATFRAQSIVADEDGRTWHTWNAGNSSLESIGGDAVLVPSFPPYNIGPTGFAAHAAPAPGGEVFATVGGAPPRLKRLTPTGAAAAGWTPTGVALPGADYHDHAVMPDGSGGVVVFLRQSTSTGVPIATRIDDNGSLHAGWPTSGVTLSSISPLNDIGMLDSQLLPSGPTHALAVWSLDAGSDKRRWMMQRFGLDATVDPAWPADGLEVVSPDTIIACRAIADGAGGAYIVRQSHGRPVATHITAAGTVLGSMDTDLLDAGAQYVRTLFGGLSQGPDDMIAAVTPDGGLLVGWNDTRLDPQVSFRLRWMTPSLAPAPDRPAEPHVYFPGSPHPLVGSMLAVHADGPDHAFIVWSDYHDIGFGQAWGDLWMTRIQAPTNLDVHPSSPSALRLSAPRPNPARDAIAFDVTLADDAPVRVELLDVAGRALRSRHVQGRGAHSLAFEGLGALPPGLYFVRALGAGGGESRRVALSR